METSTYQSIKLSIIELVSLSKDAIHIHIGLLVFFFAVMLWRRGRVDYLALLPVFFVAGVMEYFDLRDDMASLGYGRWIASAHDLINTAFWPTIAVVSSKWLERRKLIASQSSRQL